MAGKPVDRPSASVTLTDFNERVRRVLAGKPEPKKGEERRRNWTPNRVPERKG